MLFTNDFNFDIQTKQQAKQRHKEQAKQKAMPHAEQLSK